MAGASNVGLWTGLKETTGEMRQTGMGLLQFKQTQEHQRAIEAIERDRYNLAKEAAGRERMAFEHAEKKRVEQETLENSFVPASLVAPNIHKLPKFKAGAIDAVRKAGFKVEETPDGEIYATNKAFAYYNNLLKTNTDELNLSTNNIIADLTNQSITLTNKIAQLQQSGKTDEKIIGPLQQQQIAIKEQISEMINVRENVIAKRLEAQAKPVQPKTWEPKRFVGPGGAMTWINPGQPIPEGWAPYEKSITEGEKLTVWPTAAEAIKAGKSTGSIPEGKTVVAKPAKGGFIYDYESPNLAKETQERADKTMAANLRKEFNSLQPVKDYRDVQTRFTIMEEAIKESKTSKNLVATDQALISLFNKMTDPQSVVRESEYARTPQDLALWNRIKGKVSKISSGGAGLIQEDRDALVSMGKKFQQVYQQKFNALRNEYRGYAKDYGIDPEWVIKESGKTTEKETKTIGGKDYVKKNGKWYEK